MLINGRCHCGNISFVLVATFEGESEEERLGRRKRNWIAEVDLLADVPPSA